MLKLSTGLRNALLVTGPLGTILGGGRINIYAGVPPATADDALGSATLLCSITVGGGATGLSFAATATDGVLSKPEAVSWVGTPAIGEGGVGSYYRHVGAADTGEASTTEPRIQGTIALAGGDMNVTSTTFTEEVPFTLDYYTVALPGG